MTSQLKTDIATYLRAHHVVTLATSGSEGPWASAVFYVADHLDLIFLSAPHTRHARNFDGGVAGAIQENLDDWRALKGIQLEGRCHVLTGDERAAAIRTYSERFPVTGPDAPAEIAAALDKVNFYRLKSDRILFIDNARGLGHRETLELSDD